MEKIIYFELPKRTPPRLCDECGNQIEDGDECFYHWQGFYICSKECADKFEKGDGK